MDNYGGDVRLSDLPPYECWQLIETATGIARIVWTGPDGAAIVPMNFTVADGAVWFQTSPESQLARECQNKQVLVEVDHVEVADHSGWSVVVTGIAEYIDLDDVPDILGNLQVWPRGPHTVFVRVEPGMVTGRRLLPRRTP